jgi:cytochrome c oxidase assembly protein subunit 11
MKRSRRNNLLVLGLAGVLLAMMGGLVAESATLYRLFCAATGYGGTTQRVDENHTTVSKRSVTVAFTTNVAPDLPWRFAPVQREVTIPLGQDALVFFRAENLSNKDLVGHATFNVTPDEAGIYFKKIECFCFTEEKLAAGQSVEMPVDFFVDPGLATDPNTRDVDTITLSYTFFPSVRPAGAENLARFSAAGPSAEDGRTLFATDCSGCHAFDHNVVGPSLGGLIGRRAGSLAGYPSYSPALKQAGIVWTAATLDKWLAGPAQDVPGALMPMGVPDAAARRDIIAYLAAMSAAPPQSRSVARAATN